MPGNDAVGIHAVQMMADAIKQIEIVRREQSRMQEIHGGDIYRNEIALDFSVNVNPLGVPAAVLDALYKAVPKCKEYPDIKAEKLLRAVSSTLYIPKEFLVLGNGASELFAAIVHGLRPRRAVVPVPSFYGYEHALAMENVEIVFYPLSRERDYLPDDDFLDVLTENIDILFLANPNNPTGKRMDLVYLERVLDRCRKEEIYVVLDECFIEFCGEEHSMLPNIQKYDNLLIVRAFTKIFAIPGVRLGYLISSNPVLVEKIKSQLPEWNLSVFAQAAGCSCVGQQEYIQKTVAFVKTERQYMVSQLQKLGFRVCDGEANFILFHSEIPLYELLLERKILIRDCSNFRGLSEGFYRIAVRTREENRRLLDEIQNCVCEN